MCGIAGELRLGEKQRETDWEFIGELMRRRGPDDKGIWRSDDQLCTLIFRRLSILDLSPSGHQPMVTPDGRYVLVFNGEIYNFREIRERLKTRGVTFRSTGDSEVVLMALREWGVEALERFNGMFALVFYDQQERRLLLARDHAGIKPLYYLHRPAGVVFASQYDQILAHPLSQGLPVSVEALGLYLRLAFIPAPHAWIQDTYMVEPGTWIEFNSAGRATHGRYFYFPDHCVPQLSGKEAIDTLDEVIGSAVKRQMISDVPVGAFLSGGIDSPLVIAKMRSASNNSICAYTIGTGGDVTDESADAARYAAELGVKHIIEQVRPEQAVDMLDDVIAACGEPFGDYSIFPAMLVSRLASRDFKVMLSGDGGDELFWGYARRAAALIGQSRNFRQSYGIRKLRWGARKLLGFGTMTYEPSHYRSIGHWQREKHSHMKERLLARIFPDLTGSASLDQLFEYDGWDTERTAQWLRWNEFTSHLTMVLLKVDRASMHHSLEVRVPLLDREVISTALKIDWASCLDLERGQGKLPLRRILARHVAHQTQAKRGFEAPMGTWLRTSLRRVFEQSLLGRADLAGLRINQAVLREIFDHHLDGSRNYAWGLWPLLSLALWDQRPRAGGRRDFSAATSR